MIAMNGDCALVFVFHETSLARAHVWRLSPEHVMVDLGRAISQIKMDLGGAKDGASLGRFTMR